MKQKPYLTKADVDVLLQEENHFAEVAKAGLAVWQGQCLSNL